MIKYALKKWDKNKDVLRNAIQQTEKDKRGAWDYNDIVKLVCRYIFNENASDREPKINIEGITMADTGNGNHQGTLLFILPFDTDHPAEYEYLMTYVGYGSCSGCDNLQRLQRIQSAEMCNNVNSTDDLIDGYMALCKDLVSNTIRPWRNNRIFEPVNSSSKDSITCIKMITKVTLYDIMSSWLKPIIDNFESLGGHWTNGSLVDGFYWTLFGGVGNRYRAIGTNICYDNEKVIVGYDIWTGGSENVNIKIRENSIEFIEDPNFEGFSKEEIEDLYDVLKNHIMY